MSAPSFEFPALEPSGGLVLAVGTTPQQRAAEIVDAAHAQAAAIVAAAEQTGREQGRAEGLAEAATALADARAALASAAAAIEAERDAVAARVEAQAAELALLVAEKIVAAALDVSPERILDIVRGTLRRLAERDRIVVEVDPADHPLVRDAIDDVLAALGGVRTCEVFADARVGRGGCIVRTVQEEIDGRVVEQLASARERFRDALAAPADA